MANVMIRNIYTNEIIYVGDEQGITDALVNYFEIDSFFQRERFKAAINIQDKYWGGYDISAYEEVFGIEIGEYEDIETSNLLF